MLNSFSAEIFLCVREILQIRKTCPKTNIARNYRDNAKINKKHASALQNSSKMAWNFFSYKKKMNIFLTLRQRTDYVYLCPLKSSKEVIEGNLRGNSRYTRFESHPDCGIHITWVQRIRGFTLLVLKLFCRQNINTLAM